MGDLPDPMLRVALREIVGVDRILVTEHNLNKFLSMETGNDGVIHCGDLGDLEIEFLFAKYSVK